MKKLFTLLFAFVVTSTLLYSQEAPPQAIGFSGIITNSKGHVVRNSEVYLKIDIRQESSNGMIRYTEIHSTTLDKSGGFYIEIGRGIAQTPAFRFIPWGDNEFYLSVSYATTFNGPWQLVSTTQLISVPYALYAGEADYAYYAGTAAYADESGHAKEADFADIAGSVVTETVTRTLTIPGSLGIYDYVPDSYSRRDGTSIQLCSPTDSISPNLTYLVEIPIGATVKRIVFYIDTPSGTFHWTYFTYTPYAENIIASGSDSGTGLHWTPRTGLSDVISPHYRYFVRVFMEGADHICFLNCILITYEIEI